MTVRRGFTILELLVVIALLAVIAAIAIPNVMSSHRPGNEWLAICTLKEIVRAQTTFRERRLAGGRHGDLRELVEDGLLEDAVLGTGVKQGYAFEVGPSTRTPELLWFAAARPVAPRTTGDRYFAVNQAGVIYYTCAAPLLVPPATCAVPTTALPVGK